MSSFNLLSAILNQAQLQNQERVESGFVGTISPAPADLVNAVMDELALGPTDVFMDLGCGDGRWCINAARRAPVLCIGVDLDPGRIAITSSRLTSSSEDGSGTTRVAGSLIPPPLLGSIEIIQADFLRDLDMRAASVIVFYLSRAGSEMVREKACRECATGTILVAVGFSISSWIPYKTLRSSAGKLHAYFYRFGGRKDEEA